MRYRIVTSGGAVHEGDDERDEPIEMIETVVEVRQAHKNGLAKNPIDPDIPPGWLWLAEGYFLASTVIGIATVRDDHGNPIQ